VERARLVGGQAKIESKKGRGTRIVMHVPLKKEAARNGTN
jgi:two-component system sensor histidine kinase DegS